MSGEFIIFVGNFKTMKTMKKYICTVCSYIYDPAVGDPDGGIAPGTAFEDIPERIFHFLSSYDSSFSLNWEGKI